MKEKSYLTTKWDLLNEYHNTIEEIKHASKDNPTPTKRKKEEHSYIFSSPPFLMTVSVFKNKENGKRKKYVQVSAYDKRTGSDDPIFTYGSESENYRRLLEKFLKEYTEKHPFLN